MQATHRSRRFGRFVAVWLLLWFVAMSTAPVGPLSALVGVHHLESGTGDAKDVTDCGRAGHHHHHGDEQAAQARDGCAASAVEAHADHETGSSSHCPLCLHGAAPPPVVPAVLAAAETPAERLVQPTRSVRRPRTDVPPPARGPPALS